MSARVALRYRLARALLRWWLSPKHFGGGSEHLPQNPVYVMTNRSISDLIVLELIAEEIGAPSPLDACQVGEHTEARRFFFLNRPSGFWRRNTMRTHSQRMTRMLSAEDAETSDVAFLPVLVLWGRAPSRDWSFWRGLISENWSVSGRFKRLLNILFNRGDIAVHISTALPLSEAAEPGLSDELRVRRAARLLRVRLRKQRDAVLGPDFSHRRTLVKKIATSNAVQAAIERKAKDDPKLARQLQKQAHKNAATIASDLSYPTVRVLESLLTWFWNKIYDGVDFTATESLNQLAEDYTLVYVPSHRSHLDYLLLSYLLFHRGLMIPHIAAGDNLNLPVLGAVLRRGGAFFMRRSFREDDVYRTVFSEYLYQVYRRGHSVEFFPEGGRSRTGRLLRARTGLTRMTLASQARGLPKPIAFVPVYIGYEKLVEASSYLAELKGEEKRGESWLDLFRAARMIRQDFGRVSVNVGEALLLEAWMQEEPAPTSAEATQRLSDELMQRINAAADINPTNLVALSTLGMPRLAIEHQELCEQIECYQALLQDAGYEVTNLSGAECAEHAERLQFVSRETQDYGDVIAMTPNTAVLMTWYRNNVAHTLALPSLIACLMINRRLPISNERLQGMVDVVYPYLATELSIGGDDTNIDSTVETMHALQLLCADETGQITAPSPDSAEHHRLNLLSLIVMQTLERLYIVASLLTQDNDLNSRASLLAASQQVAQRLARIYGLNAPEFSDRKLLDQFLNQLIQRGVVCEGEDGSLQASELVHQVTRLARHVISVEFQRAVQRRPR